MSYLAAVRQGNDVLVWERVNKDQRILKTFRAPYYFFTKDPEGDYTSIYGEKLTRHDFATSKAFYGTRNDMQSDNIALYESDISAELRVLSENYYNVPAPTPNVTFFDIEVDYNPELGFSSIENPYAPINSVALYHQWDNVYVLLAVAPEGNNQTEDELVEAMNAIVPIPDNAEFEFRLMRDERELLVHLIAEIQDADIISGYNSDFFDTPYVAKRIERVLSKKYFRMLSFPEAKEPRYRTVSKYGKEFITLDPSGRASLDYLYLYQKYEVALKPSYKLEAIAEEVLPELPKLEYEGSLYKLYRGNFAYFLRYNVRDTEILRGFEDRLGYVATANMMCHISCGQYQHVLGTLKLAELAINNYCHHELNLRVPNTKEPQGSHGIQGALVLAPQKGMHEWIGSIDITSLYPSVIRSINISPDMLIGQFDLAETSFTEITKKSMVNLVLTFENGTQINKPAYEWRQYLLEHKYSISSHGTVFSQQRKGIIPAVLEDWFNARIKYKNKKIKYEQKARHILDKYTNS